jgi:hypothetical protein
VCQAHGEAFAVGTAFQPRIFPRCVKTTYRTSLIPAAFVDVETMVFGPGAFAAQVPFSGEKSFVAGFFQASGRVTYSCGKIVHIFRWKQFVEPSCFPPFFSGTGTNPVGNAMPCRKFARHDAGPRRAAHLAVGVSIGKNHSLRWQCGRCWVFRNNYCPLHSNRGNPNHRQE